MKLLTAYSQSHERLKDEWFIPSLQDDFELILERSSAKGEGRYRDQDWSEGVLFKSDTLIRTIRENFGQIFVYSDVDVQFFGPVKNCLLAAMEGKDIVCQCDDPQGNLCTGFFAVRANEATLRLWTEVRKAVLRQGRDQHAFNLIIRLMGDVRFGYLPASFFGTGTFHPRVWKPGGKFLIPNAPLMYHANWAVGTEHKTMLLAYVRSIVGRGYSARWFNNLEFYLCHGFSGPLRAAAYCREEKGASVNTKNRFAHPRSVSLDASTSCQLKCQSCPTANDIIANRFGSGFLTFNHFRCFIEKNPSVSTVELSNWGEIFLNPQLKEILRYAYKKNVLLTADNGANLNRAKEDVLEALVRYKFRRLSCSIDGASQETYSIYRVKGNFDNVIANIRIINAFKKKYTSPYPLLQWQYVAFGHNEHEIGNARAMAAELGMKFYLKLNWDGLYTAAFSPIKNQELIRRETGLGVADRKEYEEKFGRHFAGQTCHQLWLSPRLNFDGKLLGCSINHWGDYGNVFEHGLSACLTGEKMEYAKQMVLGWRKAKEGIPCACCKVYRSMKERDTFVRPEDLAIPYIEGRRMNFLRNRFSYPLLITLGKAAATLVSK